jgi:hypothetical protein
LEGVKINTYIQPHRRDLAPTAMGNIPDTVQLKTEAEPLNQVHNEATTGIITSINQLSGNNPSKCRELKFPAQQ